MAIHGMGIDVNFDLATPSPEEISQVYGRDAGRCKSDMIFVSCTNFRAMDAFPMLEKQFESPIITSNTATLERPGHGKADPGRAMARINSSPRSGVKGQT